MEIFLLFYTVKRSRYIEKKVVSKANLIFSQLTRVCHEVIIKWASQVSNLTLPIAKGTQSSENEKKILLNGNVRKQSEKKMLLLKSFYLKRIRDRTKTINLGGVFCSKTNKTHQRDQIILGNKIKQNKTKVPRDANCSKSSIIANIPVLRKNAFQRERIASHGVIKTSVFRRLWELYRLKIKVSHIYMRL